MQARQEGATRAYFRELCAEPLASEATAETLERFAAVASQFSAGDVKAANDCLLQIARVTAGRYRLGSSAGAGS
jgi:hypothetical protein